MEGKVDVSLVEFEDFSGTANVKSKIYGQDEIIKLGDLRLKVTAILGTRKASYGEVSNYKVGDYLEVDRIAGHTVDIYVGQEKVAVGEILEMDNQNFGLKIIEVLDKSGDFLKNVKKNGEVE